MPMGREALHSEAMAVGRALSGSVLLPLSNLSRGQGDMAVTLGGLDTLVPLLNSVGSYEKQQPVSV